MGKRKSNGAVLENVARPNPVIVVTPDDVLPAGEPTPASEPAPLNPTVVDEIRALVSVKNTVWSRQIGDFTATIESNSVDTVDRLLVKALDRFADRLAQNDYANALLAFESALPAPATLYLAPIITTKDDGKVSVRRATTGLNNAYMRLTAAGKMAGGMRYVAATIPTRKIDGEKVPGGTRLFKRA